MGAFLEEMAMFERLRNGWRLAMESFRILRSDKKLLVFPLLSGVACLLVFASFAIPLFNSPLGDAVLRDQRIDSPLAYVILFLFYFVNYFVIVFFNSALVACALTRFNGGEPTLGGGLSAAASRLPQILGWAAVSATVGVILRVIEDRSEKVGQFIAGLLGMAWTVVTYFVVPVLVVEKVGPVAAAKRSLQILRQNWGESLSARFSLGLLNLLLFLLALIPFIIGLMIGNLPAILVGVGVSIFLMIVISLVIAAVNVIAQALLYQFAVHKPLPAEIDESLLRGAFVSK